MVYEKTFYQKVNTVADWIIRIIMLNILMIITSLPVITILPSIAAGYKMFHRYIHKEEEKLFKGYFEFFLQDFGKKFSVGLVLIIVIGLGYLNVTYYVDLLNASNNIFYLVGYYLTLAVLTSTFIIMLYSMCILYVLPNLKIILLLKLAFYLSGKYFFKTILLVLTTAVPFLMLLMPITQVMFVFAGVSIPLLLNVLITHKVVDYIEGLVSEDV